MLASGGLAGAALLALLAPRAAGQELRASEASASAEDAAAYAALGHRELLQLDPGGLVFQEGGVPNFDAGTQRWFDGRLFEPYARLDSGGEIYFVRLPPVPQESRLAGWSLAARVPGAAPGEVHSGALYIPGRPEDGAAAPRYTRHAFRWTLPADPLAARVAFFEAKAQAYQVLREQDLPGAAWFRREEHAARGAAGTSAVGVESRWRTPQSEFERTFNLYSGGRAVAENLQLDVVLGAVLPDNATASVPLDSIAGIATQAIDWSAIPLEGELAPDALARFVPEDQHALFASSFADFVRLADELEQNGERLAMLSRENAGDAATRARYERQLCLELDGMARALGATLVRSVAVTGSDPYYRMGTDVAVLFESPLPQALVGALAGRQALALGSEAGASAESFELAGFEVQAVTTPDRRVCSYLARAEDLVLVTNSRVQIERIGAVRAGALPALASLGEYAFFRSRYPSASESETAFAILSDAAIRRWCSPRWRIGASRRMLAAAWLVDRQAAALAAEVEGGERPELTGALPGALGSGARWSERGPVSDVYGSLEFQTPIAELDFERVTESERDAYLWFKGGYESNWRRFFDPIGISIAVADAELATDVTVMPLIAGSDYEDLTGWIGGKRLEEQDGDPHEVLFQYAMALDTEGREFQQLDRMSSSFLDGLGFSPLSWVGDHVSFYAEDEPIWDELEDYPGNTSAFLQDKLGELPLACTIGVRDPLRLAGFLTALRGLSDSSAPDMLEWENREHAGRGYVRVGSDLLTPGGAIYYATLPGALVIGLGEGIVQRAIERHTAPAGPRAATSFAGQSMGVRVEQGAWPVVAELLDVENEIAAESWSALPILNEWRLRFGAEDAVLFHERAFGERLVEPLGGSYVWNEEWQTYESSVAGSPATPGAAAGLEALALEQLVRGVRAASFGLTFEHDGLRARLAVQREAH